MTDKNRYVILDARGKWTGGTFTKAEVVKALAAYPGGEVRPKRDLPKKPAPQAASSKK